jgi:putative ABC transport system ATP-binding protein
MIRINSLTKVYDETVVLKEIDYKINKGDFVVFSGPSGSGKSTLLSIISGMSRPTNGEVFIDNINISKLPEEETARFRNERIGFVFQKFNLIENFSVYENIMVPLIVTDYPDHEIKSKVNSILNIFAIQHKAHTKVKKLSGGEQQRVALSRALVNNPEILIGDEPTANLDTKLKNDVINLLLEINRSNKTVIVATHDEIFLKIEGVKKVFLEDGKIKNIA